MTDPRKPSIRRHRADERIDALDTSPAAVAAAFEKLRADADATVARVQAERDEALAKVESERDEFLAALQRERAEFTNFRQRTAKEREMERGLAAAFEKLRADADATVARVQAERDEALAKVESERDEFLAALQRERAEFTNFRQRTAKEREMERGLAGVDLITKVLTLADDFDRAIDSRPDALADSPWAEGIANIDRKLRGLLESEGVIAVEAKPGSDFDPREHEAIASVAGTGLPDGVIVEEVRRGYRLRDRLIRPALVAVAQGGEDTPASRPN